MYYCCKGIGNCCQSCCKGIQKCCTACCQVCNCQWCNKPFAPCVFLNFFLVFIPGLICLSGALVGFGGDCDIQLPLFSLLQAFLLTLNFLIFIYLMIKFNKPSEQDPQNKQDICTKTYKLICYDVVICIYIFVLIFAVIWTILGSVWLSSSDCNQSYVQFTSYLGIIIMWIFLGLSFFLFCCSFIIAGCQDGSCGFDKCCTNLCYICCCCFCFDTKKKKFQQQRVQRIQRQNEQQEKRPGFVSSAVGVLRWIGIKNDNQPRRESVNYFQPGIRQEMHQNPQNYPEMAYGHYPPSDFQQPAVPYQAPPVPYQNPAPNIHGPPVPYQVPPNPYGPPPPYQAPPNYQE